MSDWFKVNCQARITKAVFDFEKNTFTVTGMIDFDGRDHDGLLSKEFTHSWDAFGEDISKLEEILTSKCGNDLFGPEKTMRALQEKHK